MYYIQKMVDHTFPKVMIPINIQAEFRVAGLVQVNRDVFDDCYFMPAKTRDYSKPVSNTTQETDNSVLDAVTPSTSGYTFNVCITPECDVIQDYSCTVLRSSHMIYFLINIHSSCFTLL